MCNKRGTFGEREKKRDWKREKGRDSFAIFYTGYLSSIIKIKRSIERQREKEGKGERERKRGRGREKERESERDRQRERHTNKQRGRESNK